MSSDVLRAKSALGVATRRGDTEAIATARSELAAANLAAYVKKTVNAAPPLTPEQLARVSALLRPAGGGAK